MMRESVFDYGYLDTFYANIVRLDGLTSGLDGFKR